MGPATNAISWRRVIYAVTLFVTGFVAVAAVVHAAIRNDLRLHADIRSEKLMVMDEWQGKAYSAAFGSSHVHNGFDPRTFDIAMAGSPLQTRSLNLAIAGGSQSEQRVTALEFLRHIQPPAKIGSPLEAKACMVILELNAGANFTNDHLVHPRAINIYDAETARFIWRLTSPEMSLTQKVGRIGYSILAMALHYTNVGMLSSTVFAPPIDQASLDAETRDDRRGLLSMPTSTKAYMKLEEIVAAAPATSTGTPQELLPGNRDLLDELAAASPVRNLQMAYIVMPKLSDMWGYPVTPTEIAWSDGMAPVVDMARPDLYPELYQAKYWMDDAHLNERGAALMTRLVAENLKAWYAAHGEPARCGG